MFKFKPSRYLRLIASVAFASSVLTGPIASAASTNWWIDITNDRVEAVKTELALGEDPNVRNEKGQPAIMQAIQDETPLMYLAIVGDTKRARALIERGAKVSRLGWTPLHYAASKGNVEMVNMLIQSGAIVDAPAPDGTTPLMMAAFSGDDATVRAVLAAGAEPTTQNLQKLDAADWARNKEFTSLADRLEDLIQQTLAQRGSGSSQSAPVRATATRSANTDRMGAAATGGAQGTTSAGATLEPSDPQAQAEGSSSRYFDLDRFERDDNQF